MLAFLLVGGLLAASPASNAKAIGTAVPPKESKSASGAAPAAPKKLQAPVEPYPEAAAAAKGANDFAFRLSAALAAQTGDEKNLVCSPYSVWLPLAALVNAADEQNKAALLETLGAGGISEADINNAASRMLYSLTNQYNKGEDGYHNPLKIANAIFVSNRATLKKDFAQTFMDYYRGSAMNVDFKSQEAVDTVNKWASDNTDGLITDIIEEFDPNTIAAIANAIYFSDRWEWEFNPERTKEDIFHSPTGETTAFYMLREGDGQLYYEDDQIQAMPLSFRTNGGLYIILPKDGDAAGLLSSMTNEYFDTIQKGSSYATGRLLLPRFSIESDAMRLKDTLMALGVPLFAPGSLTELVEETPVRISRAVQKAAIKVDEKGTTAAAVTVMDMADGAAELEPTKPFDMNCNKPFVFVLYGYTRDGGKQVLFTGIVNQPQG